MNSERRKKIEIVKDKLTELKSLIEPIMEEEQEAFDNLPESLQYSDRGEKMEEAINSLENSLNSIDEVVDYLDEAMQ